MPKDDPKLASRTDLSQSSGFLFHHLKDSFYNISQETPSFPVVITMTPENKDNCSHTQLLPIISTSPGMNI